MDKNIVFFFFLEKERQCIIVIKNKDSSVTESKFEFQLYHQLACDLGWVKSYESQFDHMNMYMILLAAITDVIIQ